MKYRFLNEDGEHLHQLYSEVNQEWENLTGCTTVLSVIAKPALIQWAADMAVEQFGWIKAKEWKDGKMVEVSKAKRLEMAKKGFENISNLDGDKYLEMLDKARVAHCKRKERAGKYGTETHEAIERLINEAIKNNGGHIKETLDLINGSILNFGKWATENKVKFLESEKNTYSVNLFIGGIVDFICEIDGKVWIGDIKTSGSGIYAEHFWQCAGYNLMLEEMGLYKDVAGYLILNLKESGEMLEERSTNNAENKEAFLSALKIYRIQERIKKKLKK